MPTIEVETNALLKFVSLFEHGVEKASTDFSGLLLEAANYIEYLQSTGNEALKRKAELEQKLVETEQYLAVAEGQADGGPPGWVKKGLNRDHNWWVYAISSDACLYVDRWKPSGRWVWKVDFNSRSLMLTGTEGTAREAIAAAEAAYQEAIRQ